MLPAPRKQLVRRTSGQTLPAKEILQRHFKKSLKKSKPGWDKKGLMGAQGNTAKWHYHSTNRQQE
jgi:hypothetical protein